VKEPPSTNISPGPVSCSRNLVFVSKPPFLELLYFHPVVEDVFELDDDDPGGVHEASAKTHSKTNIN